MRIVFFRGVGDVCYYCGCCGFGVIICYGGCWVCVGYCFVFGFCLGIGKMGLKELQGMEKGSGVYMDNVLVFVLFGVNLLEVVCGDLIGNGFQDQFLVID